MLRQNKLNKRFKNYFNQKKNLFTDSSFFILTKNLIFDKVSQFFFKNFLLEKNILNIRITKVKKKQKIFKNINYVLILPLVLFNKQFFHSLSTSWLAFDIDLIFLKLPNYQKLISFEFLINFYKINTQKNYYLKILRIFKLYLKGLLLLLLKKIPN